MRRIFSFPARASLPMPETRPVCSSIPPEEQVEVPSVGSSLQNLSNRRIDCTQAAQITACVARCRSSSS